MLDILHFTRTPPLKALELFLLNRRLARFSSIVHQRSSSEGDGAASIFISDESDPARYERRGQAGGEPLASSLPPVTLLPTPNTQHLAGLGSSG